MAALLYPAYGDSSMMPSTIFHYFRAALSDPALFREALRKYLRRMSRRRGRATAFPTELREGGGDISARELVALLAQSIGVLRLEDTETRQWIGVADTRFSAALEALRAAWPDAQDIAPFHKGAAIGLHRRPDQRIYIERYEQRGTDHWVSDNPHNDIARAIYDDRLDEPGLHESADLLGGQTAGQRRDALPVDAVCTWVDDADPAWQALYAAHVASYRGTTDAASLARFLSHDNLRYSLRSMASNIPWLRRIHIVSNCAPPRWLDIDHPTVVWVDHAAILPPAALPTFNSHAIETRLQDIPDLSEHFIYFNDDMFVCRPLGKGKFFAQGGESCAFLETGAMVTGAPVSGAPDYLNAARTSAALIRTAFDSVPVRLHKHAPYSLRRSVLKEIVERFPEAIARTETNRFRDIGDVNLTSFLYHHYALRTGQAQEHDIDAAFVKSSDLRWRAQVAAVRPGASDFLCLNDGGIVEPGRAWQKVTRQMLDRFFPDSAPWEKP